MDQSVVPALGYAPDRAIRARLNAIFLDGILLGVLSGLVISGVASGPGGGVVVVLVVNFLYFFFQEAYRGGKTVGKRTVRLRVVQLDGSPPTTKQIAIRNALRFFDALPLFYASGLVSVMWTGPGRRQRIGDRVAGTTVILEPGGKSMETPGWLLPMFTVTGVLLSVIVYGALYDAYRAPHVDANALRPAVVTGFVGDNSQAPEAGTFDAQAQIQGAPVVDVQTGKPMLRSWIITKRCASSGPCTYEITRDVPGVGDESGDLVPEADGWHVDFPTRSYKASCFGSLTNVMSRASFVIHFDPGGHAAQAHETTLVQSDSCGVHTLQLDWDATAAALPGGTGF